MSLTPGDALSSLAEINELERLIQLGAHHLQARQLCQVDTGEQRFPVLAVTLGNPDPAVPAIGLFGGVHGLERIGAQVVLAYLGSLVMRLRWDKTLQTQLESLRMVFMPLVNPGGLWQGTRANPRGVDLMRNAPVEAAAGVPLLIGGQRLSARLPWYRGEAGAAMEAENQALCGLVEEELLAHRFALSIDCHSGFGFNDRIWFPYAHTAQPLEHLAEIHALCDIMDQTHAQHRYVFEPQSRQYLTHGDIWDHLYRRASALPGTMLLPLTLEMGSWLWVKKNPRQLFSRDGIFNPLIGHRQQRVLRRHIAWLDFCARAASSAEAWLPQGEARERHRELALTRWYRRRREQA
ncbi:M14 family zinc carboxypeptidase [Paucibacter sp. APW11]|uniref:M14 family zinc carboxypeptidase n=1 Tax=Roseateles aquae TaxID=3077235 RepID=A0ABU3P7R0_9BURK|nr:M14 family zinc carboxypeptidase [Paucibacter sp. APW11]MDT8998250.1 M14 family zinc carboxypeptidase [Paucibacter sp. APW11]